MQREIVQLTCDGCGKTAQKTGELYRNGMPTGWETIVITHVLPNVSIDVDVCSSGCAENATIKVLREYVYVENH